MAWLDRLPLQQQLSAPVVASRLVDNDTVFVEQHRIRGYEVGPDRQATILTIANLLQVLGDTTHTTRHTIATGMRQQSRRVPVGPHRIRLFFLPRDGGEQADFCRHAPANPDEHLPLLVRLSLRHCHASHILAGVTWCRSPAGARTTRGSPCHVTGASPMPTPGRCTATAQGGKMMR